MNLACKQRTHTNTKPNLTNDIYCASHNSFFRRINGDRTPTNLSMQISKADHLCEDLLSLLLLFYPFSDNNDGRFFFNWIAAHSGSIVLQTNKFSSNISG